MAVAAVATASAAAIVLRIAAPIEAQTEAPIAARIVLRANVAEAVVRGPMSVAEDVILCRQAICPPSATS
jgi:hypothetical protein